MPVRHYRDLVARQESMDLVRAVYRLTQDWPKEELYGLTSQIRRSVVYIPSNIAEGHGRAADKEFAHHLRIARGSLWKLERNLQLH